MLCERNLEATFLQDLRDLEAAGITHRDVAEDMALDLFVAGDSTQGKAIASQLAQDTGFSACYDIGGNDKFELMEQFAWFWINLAMFKGQGREIGFKLLKR